MFFLLSTHLMINLMIFVFFAFIAVTVAWKENFFSQAKIAQVQKSDLSFTDFIGAFLLYFFVQLLATPFIALVVVRLTVGQWSFPKENLGGILYGWLYIFSTVLSFLVVGGYFLFKRHRLSLRKNRRLIRDRCEDILNGIIGWLVSYPLVMVIGHLVGIVVSLVFSVEEEEQVVVKYVRTIVEDPALFWPTAALMTFVVPITEELLFRGFLQTWLRQKMKWFGAIISASGIFTLFHFSTDQGHSNIQLSISLFLFSCFLGFLYERRRSLLAPITLHVLFNAVAVVRIIIE